MILTKFTAKDLEDFFIGGANVLKTNKALVDALNVFPVPDGDTGTNMSLTVSAAVKEIKSTEADDIRLVAKELAHGSLMGARGNSGVIFSQIVRGISQGFDGPYASPVTLAKAMKRGSDLAYQSVMKPVEGTVLTVVRAMAEAALEAAYSGKDCLGVLEAAILNGEATLSKTPQMLPSLKRAGVVDAGGKGLLFVFQGGVAALKGEELKSLGEQIEESTVETQGEESCEYGYCTELILRGDNLSLKETRNELSKLGDSLLVVGDENTLKIHIHTQNPGAVLQYIIQFGSLHDIKIDNMSEQHQEKIVEAKQLAVVAVASGEGMEQIFTSLGVDRIVSGGQSMNPSTEDLFNAVKEIGAQEVIILPNNKNIIPAAEQVVGLLDNVKVSVVPTKNMLQGISAMTLFDETKTGAENTERMSHAYEHITSIEVTYAVRDTQLENLSIKKGDFLGLLNGQITINNDSAEKVLLEAITKAVNEDHEIVTVFYGEGITENIIDSFKQNFEEHFPELELEVHFGGQPVYSYLASVE